MATWKLAGVICPRSARTLSNGDSFLRLRKPARLTLPQARDMVRARASVAVADLNHYFRPGNAAACTGGDCPMRQMIDWPADTTGCGTPPRIGMVDTGLNDKHPGLSSAQLRLHRLEAACLPHNEPSKGVLTKVGFHEEGLARQYLRINGQWADHLLFALLRADYDALLRAPR